MCEPIGRARLLILALLCSFAIITCARADVDNTPVVILRVDDCTRTWLTPFTGLDGMSGLQYGILKRIPITWAVITDQATYGASLTWSDLQTYLDAAGGEAASHSASHTELQALQNCIDEVARSKTAIDANLPNHHCTSFIQPGGWSGDTYIDSFAELENPLGKAIQSNYSQSMAYLGDGWRIGDVYYPHGMCSTWSIDGPNYPSVEAINATLEIAASTPGVTYILKIHGVQEQEGTTAYQIPADLLKYIMDKLSNLRDHRRVRLLTLNEAYHARFSPDLNHVPDPGFELSSVGSLNPTGPWTFNGTTTISANGGLNNSHYVYLIDGSYFHSAQLIIAPGRYQVSWYQKNISGTPNNGLFAYVYAFGPPNLSMSRPLLNWTVYRSTAPDIWEQKTAIIFVPYGFAGTEIGFKPVQGASYGVDNVSITCLQPAPPVSSSISDVLLNPDGTLVAVSGVISAVFGNYGYIEQPDRARGIRVQGLTQYPVGTATTAVGKLISTNGERAIDPSP